MKPLHEGTNRSPIPDASVLKNWKVKNSSEPFDEEAAIRYLERTEAQFAERIGRIVDSLLTGTGAPGKK
ncbi:hypothetical protein [Azospirillum thermophilum]|uniref:Uncharacterized protein n=1 Tax=Azospirillum thermophilum TaxID=2202148 RepID=A0A2S2CTD6_9PROT|nr:hypothetical protein [Azospirillum thermophilum]AWK87771.1 hypothetical protein DEW08_17640 [Azospirillum thermophilum]